MAVPAILGNDALLGPSFSSGGGRQGGAVGATFLSKWHTRRHLLPMSSHTKSPNWTLFFFFSGQRLEIRYLFQINWNDRKLERLERLEKVFINADCDIGVVNES